MHDFEVHAARPSRNRRMEGLSKYESHTSTFGCQFVGRLNLSGLVKGKYFKYAFENHHQLFRCDVALRAPVRVRTLCHYHHLQTIDTRVVQTDSCSPPVDSSQVLQLRNPFPVERWEVGGQLKARRARVQNWSRTIPKFQV